MSVLYQSPARTSVKQQDKATPATKRADARQRQGAQSKRARDAQLDKIRGIAPATQQEAIDAAAARRQTMPAAFTPMVPMAATPAATLFSTSARPSYGLGQHGAKKREQARLKELHGADVSGSTHESEHPWGYAVLRGEANLKRGAGGVAGQVENAAPAFQEVKAAHKAHPGTGTKGHKLAKPFQFGPENVFTTGKGAATSAGWSSDAYRVHQRNALEEGRAGNALQLNQLAYGHNPDFKRKAGNVAQLQSDSSYTTMLQHTDHVTIAHAQHAGEALVHSIPLTRREKIESELARRVARGDYNHLGGYPDAAAEDAVRSLYPPSYDMHFDPVLGEHVDTAGGMDVD